MTSVLFHSDSFFPLHKRILSYVIVGYFARKNPWLKSRHHDIIQLGKS